MTKRSTLQRSGQAMFYNFLLNEALASQVVENYMLWIASPWVTNFRLPTPYHVSFSEVVASRQESLYLFDVLYQIAANGGQVRVVVGPDSEHHPPLRRLAERSRQIEVRLFRELHAKAYAGHFGAMDGSMNLTGSGVNQNAELYDYRYDDRSIVEIRQRCREFFDRGAIL